MAIVDYFVFGFLFILAVVSPLLGKRIKGRKAERNAQPASPLPIKKSPQKKQPSRWHWKLGWKVRLIRAQRYFRSKKKGQTKPGNPALSPSVAKAQAMRKRIKRVGITFVAIAVLLIIGENKLASGLSASISGGKIVIVLLVSVLIYFLIKAAAKHKDDGKKRHPILATAAIMVVLVFVWWGVDKYEERSSPSYMQFQLANAKREADSLRAIANAVKTDTIKVMASKFGSRLVRIPFGKQFTVHRLRAEPFAMSYHLANGRDTTVQFPKSLGHQDLPGNIPSFELFSVDSDSLPLIVEVYSRR